MQQDPLLHTADLHLADPHLFGHFHQSDGNEIYLVDQVIGDVGSVGHSVLESGNGGSAVCEDTEKEKLLNHMLLEQLLGGLEEKERELIHLRYFQDKTQVEVAKKMGISQVQVSRMEKRILLHLAYSRIPKQKSCFRTYPYDNSS